MGTAIWRVTSLAGNKIANYLLSFSIIFLIQIFYPELISRNSTTVDDPHMTMLDRKSVVCVKHT